MPPSFFPAEPAEWGAVAVHDHALGRGGELKFLADGLIEEVQLILDGVGT